GIRRLDAICCARGFLLANGVGFAMMLECRDLVRKTLPLLSAWHSRGQEFKSSSLLSHRRIVLDPRLSVRSERLTHRLNSLVSAALLAMAAIRARAGPMSPG